MGHIAPGSLTGRLPSRSLGAPCPESLSMAVSPVLARLLESHPGPRDPEPKPRTAFTLNRELGEELEKPPEGRSLERVVALLKEGADPWNTPEGLFGVAPLTVAVLHHWWEAARLLVSFGAVWEDPDRSGPSRKWGGTSRRLVALGCVWEEGTVEDVEWVRRVLNRGVLRDPGVTLEFYQVNALIRQNPQALSFLIKEDIHLMSPEGWLMGLVCHAASHGLPDEQTLGLYLALPAPSDEFVVHVWSRSLLSAEPSPLVPFLAEHHPLDFSAGSRGVSLAWNALVSRETVFFFWLMGESVVEKGLRHWLLENPSALQEWLCKEESFSRDCPLHMASIEALEKYGLLPSLPDMEQWEGPTVDFCLRQMVRKRLMTPAILDWVDAHWQDALHVVWKDGEPTLLEELAMAFEKRILPFNGKVRLEQRWLQAAVPDRCSSAGTKTGRL